jgi:hypothetical protein
MDDYGGFEKPKRRRCHPKWQETGILIANYIGLVLFLVLLGALVLKGGELHETSESTIGMRKDTLEMRANAEAWIKQFRSNFPSNQEVLTTQQVLDIVDKSSATVEWIESVTHAIPKELPGHLMGNLTQTLNYLNVGFTSPSKKRDPAMQDASAILSRVRSWAESISSEEFHSGFAAATRFMQVIGAVDDQKVAKIVDVLGHIFQDVDKDKFVDKATRLAKGAGDFFERFQQPGGLRIELPIAGK